MQSRIFKLLMLSILALTACKFEKNHSQYELLPLSEGKVLRMDTLSGQISIVTEKGVVGLPDDKTVKLEIGRLYLLNDGSTAIYEGGYKLTTDKKKIIDALVDKYKTKQ